MTPNHIPMGLLSISGESAKQLLQGQFTCNLDDIKPPQGLLGAHCNPQGRIIYLFRLFEANQHYYLYLPAAMAHIALQTLQKYAVFFKVKITDASEELNNAEPLAPAIADNRLWIETGTPMIYPETSEQFLPHEINLHLLNGISFNKGCYTGQEIIARMHYRGKLKKHMQRFASHTAYDATRGTDVFSAEGTAATLVDYCKTETGMEYLIITAKNPPALYMDAAFTEALTPLTLPYDIK